MTGRFTDIVLDTHIAPEASALKSAEIPDMSEYDPQLSHWVANNFLNSVLRGRFERPISVYAHNYLRRAEGAFAAHNEARQKTLQFIKLDRQAPGVYARALSQWEAFLTHAWQAEALLMKLIEQTSGERYEVFTRGDESMGERLHMLYNSMKHTESRIAAGQIPEGGLVPVWLTNDGLTSTDTQLSYTETGEILEEIAHWANVFVDPIDARNKVRDDDDSEPLTPVE